MTPKQTIKGFAQELLARVDFHDCYGRPIGLDYITMLAMIRREFPRARTTRNALKYIYDSLDRSSIRLPARYRSRKILAREYVKALLLHPSALTHHNIYQRVRRKFGDTPIEVRSVRRIERLALSMERQGFKVMARADD
jgi:hypothetical protein